jgi:hypothetical protein
MSCLLSREAAIAHCPHNEVESELHFLASCQMYEHIRDKVFPSDYTDPQRIWKQIQSW